MHNILLLERYLPSSFFWPNLIKDIRIDNLSVEELLDKYKGFEGTLISYFEVDNSFEFQQKIDQCLEIKKIASCLLLHIISHPNIMPNSLKEQALLVGYDVGVCSCDEEAIYSSIFNEILFGHLDELVAFKGLLNENFLFPDRTLAEKYVRVHDELSSQGKDVEDYFKMTIYEIWKFKDPL